MRRGTTSAVITRESTSSQPKHRTSDPITTNCHYWLCHLGSHCSHLQYDWPQISLPDQTIANEASAHYLLNPGPGTNVSPRPGAAIAIIVIYFVLLFPMAITYFRILHVVFTNPGYVAQGKPTLGVTTRFDEEPQKPVQRCCTSTTVAERPSSSSDSTRKDGAEKKMKPGKPPLGQTIAMLDPEGIFRGDVPPPPGIERYYSKEVFACDPHGLPIWCGICCNWKPDRSHHCSDVGRCVMKLDHFCPW